MKLKQSPEDFQVEEITAIIPAEGAFALYRLEKTGWSTPDALAAIRRRWQIDLRRLSYGGLKDRHAHTVQYFTIFRGPRRNLTHHGITVSYLGQVAAAYTSGDIAFNRFRLVLRDITPEQRQPILTRLARIQAQGVPNYFDDQRFGSAGEGFMARHLVLGEFEAALKLALTGGYEHDRAEQKREKALLLEHWGNWATLKEQLPRGHARSLVDYLRVHPGDLKGAVVRLRPELRGLYLSAYQSHLWNRTLARWLTECVPRENLVFVTLRLGDVPMHFNLDDATLTTLRSLALPLATARWKPEPTDGRLPFVQAVLAEEGLTLEQMKVRGVRDLFFSRGDRAALCVPANLTHDFFEDERHKGRLKLNLSFDLPRGSYATLLVKAVTSE